MLIECPSCHTQVWVTKTRQCPACRKQVPDDVLEKAAAEAGIDLNAPAPVSTGLIAEQSTMRTAYEADTYSPITDKTEPPRRKVVQRTSWGFVVFGLLLIMAGLPMLYYSGEPSTGPRLMSRRTKAVENLLGEQGMNVFVALGIMGVGGLVICSSRTEVTVADPSEATTKECDLCGQTSANNGEAFITVGGGTVPFTGAFKCHACNSCVRSAGRIWTTSVFQSVEFIFGAILGIPVILLCVLFIVSLVSGTERKPGAEIFMGVVFGIGVILLATNIALYYLVRRWTTQLLGPKMDSVVRHLTGIKQWGWPRRVAVSRYVAVNTPTFELSQGEESK